MQYLRQYLIMFPKVIPVIAFRRIIKYKIWKKQMALLRALLKFKHICFYLLGVLHL